MEKMFQTAQRPNSRRKRLGECLIEAGVINEATLNKALEIQKFKKKKIGQILKEIGELTDKGIAKALSSQLNIPLIQLSEMEIPQEVVSLVPAEVADSYSLVPVKEAGKKLIVATANPLEIFYALDDLRFITRMPVEIAVAPESDILKAIERYYPEVDIEKDLELEPGLEDEVEFIHQEVKEEDDSVQDLRNLSSLPPIVRFVNKIFADGIRLKASDIHIEPQKAAVLLRYRVDGIMREVMKTDRRVHPSLVSRIKVISNMDISVRRRPQDGRSQVKFGNKSYDLRVSTIPTSYGEKVTIRILDQTDGARRVEDLDLSEKHFQAFTRALSRPQGIILVTGPTGSGKSSTLYACLNRLNTPQVNIVTVEDPVEFDIPGVNQVQIHPQAGITFASGLRSILRQDPDIVMVGEIRDSETAGTAFQAGQTGHLVLSTLHTNDALSSVARLMDLGVPPFLISDSLLAVVGQRLVRRICPHCRTPDSISSKMLKKIASYFSPEEEVQFYKGEGCAECQYTGYSGRMAIFEILTMTPSLKEKIRPEVGLVSIQKAAEEDGYQPMIVDGLRKAAQGMTTLEELLRVTSTDLGDVSPSAFRSPSAPEVIDVKEIASDYPASIRVVPSKKILVAEDNEVTSKLLCRYLESANYLVETARTGAEAVKIATRHTPDLIITDLKMPEMDGLGLIQRIRTHFTTKYIPIIMITVEDDVGSEIRAIDAGADDYITKPIVSRTLLARVNRLLSNFSNF